MGIGVWQLGLLLAIIVIVFGVGKLPNVMGDIGKGITSFKKGLREGDEKPDDTPSISNTKEISDKNKDDNA